MPIGTDIASFFLYFAVAVCVAYGVRFLALGWRSWQSLRWIQTSGELPLHADTCDRRIVLLCPLYEERRWVSNLVDQLSSLDYRANGLKIGFVLSEDDTSETRSELSKRLQRSELPFETETVIVAGGNKAESLNMGLTQLGEDHPGWFEQSTYIGVFDVDTSIESNMLQFVGCDDETPVAYTGTSIYGLNLHEFEGIRKRILQAFAIMQTQWALGFEFARVINDYENDRKKLKYIVGHGSFYRWDFLAEYGFPECVDDIPLGYLITSQGYQIKPLPSIEVIGVAVTVRDLIFQLSNWYRAGYSMFRFTRYTDEVSPKMSLNLLYEPFVTVLPWTFAPLLLLMSGFYLVLNAPVVSVAAGLWVFVTASVSGILTHRAVANFSTEDESITDDPPWGIPYLVYPFLKTAGAWHRIFLVALDAVGVEMSNLRTTPKDTRNNEN